LKLQDYADFKDAITATAQHLHISEVIVEKDYWVTYALKNIVQNNIVDDVVFKGGTSLSKAYNIIKRFSEDVDLAAINLNGLPSNQIQNKIRDLSKKVSANLPEINGKSTKGTYMRRTYHSYPTNSVVEENSPIEKIVLLEINSITFNLKYQKFPISTFIYDFLKAQNSNDLIKKYELEPFEINVLEKERTFSEKILALSRYSNENDNNVKIKSKIRHFYDLCMLLKDNDIKKFLDSDNFLQTIKIVRENDNSTPIFGQPWLNNKIKDSKLMKYPEETWEELKSTYKSGEMTSLIFEDKPDEDEILDTLKKISERIKHLEE